LQIFVPDHNIITFLSQKKHYCFSDNKIIIQQKREGHESPFLVSLTYESITINAMQTAATEEKSWF
jgi:hypothetical protein